MVTHNSEDSLNSLFQSKFNGGKIPSSTGIILYKAVYRVTLFDRSRKTFNSFEGINDTTNDFG